MAKVRGFLRGFAAGMASPYTVFHVVPTRYDTGSTDLVALAWRDVGEAMWTAIENERQRHEEIAGEEIKTK